MTSPALAGILIVVVMTAGAVSAAAVVNRGSSAGGAVRNDGTTLDADGTVRAAGKRLAAVDAAAAASRASRLPESTSTTGAPATTVTTGRPGSTSTSTSAPKSTSTSTSVANTSDPIIVKIPYTAGRTSWTGVSEGVTITVKVDKANPAAGEAVHFDVEASSATHACCVIVVKFGDGSQYGQQNETGPCAPGAPQGHGPVTASTSHTYGRNNQYMFEVRALTGNCDDPGGAPTLFGELLVGSPSTGQGPMLPNVMLARSGMPHPGDRTWAWVVAVAKDDDGWVRTARLDWGDGTPPEVYPTGMTCRSSLTGWPDGTQIMFGAVGSGEGIHHYAAPGAYTVTVTAVSTGCDGTVTQTGTGSLVWDTA
ncbi:MAG: hypothetical protein M3Y04_09730 [Actinomycetota bacterium]|nr:hypothetical protein [Actinomycetota bacterium]